MNVEWPPKPLAQLRVARQLVRAAHSLGSSVCPVRSTSTCREGYLEESDVATHSQMPSAKKEIIDFLTLVGITKFGSASN